MERVVGLFECAARTGAESAFHAVGCLPGAFCMLSTWCVLHVTYPPESAHADERSYYFDKLSDNVRVWHLSQLPVQVGSTGIGRRSLGVRGRERETGGLVEETDYDARYRK